MHRLRVPAALAALGLLAAAWPATAFASPAALARPLPPPAGSPQARPLAPSSGANSTRKEFDRSSDLAGSPQARPLDLHRDLPRDPLAVVAGRLDDPDEALESLSAALALGGTALDVRRLLEGLESSMGFPVRERLLTALGPEWALVIDLPPVDHAVARMDGSGAQLVSVLLSRVGLVVGVRDEAATRAAASALLDALGIAPVDEGEGLWRIRVRTATSPAAGADEFGVVYGIARGRLAVGLSREWVVAMLDERGPGQSLEHGADFARVFVHLDPDARQWMYLNLPQARRLLGESVILRGLLGGTPAGRVRVEEALRGSWMDVGLGVSSVVVDGGLRTSSFGPRGLASGLLAGGVAAVAGLPTLLRSTDQHRALETLEDMERIAGACERFSTDAAGYPGPTDGLWPVERIAAYLEPIYLHTLPRHDAWNNPILYWSDGSSYRLVSTGQDGAMDRDWTRPGPIEIPQGPASDIVFDTGRVVVGPGLD